jgi:hypothetical protein
MLLLQLLLQPQHPLQPQLMVLKRSNKGHRVPGLQRTLRGS